MHRGLGAQRRDVDQVLLELGDALRLTVDRLGGQSALLRHGSFLLDLAARRQLVHVAFQVGDLRALFVGEARRLHLGFRDERVRASFLLLADRARQLVAQPIVKRAHSSRHGHLQHGVGLAERG